MSQEEEMEDRAGHQSHEWTKYSEKPTRSFKERSNMMWVFYRSLWMLRGEWTGQTSVNE